LDMEGSPFKPRGWGVGLRDENTLLATTYGRVDFDEPSGGVIEDGEWRHLAYIFHPDRGSVEFFIDGESTGIETDSPVGMANALANDDYLIGALNLTSTNNGQFFRGLIDDVRIYDGPLSPSEIRSIMAPSSDAEGTVRYLVPQNATVDSTWMQNNFDDSSWLTGPAAIGYQINPIGIGGVIKQPVPRGTRSVYIRKSFHVDDANDVSSVVLRMKYDDGFVAYLNGSVIATSNAPNSLRFDSVASSNRDNSLAAEWTFVDVSRHSDLLVDGTNVLAIHALNDSASSNEFLISPDLIVVGKTHVYLDAATPGTINSNGNDFGPLIKQVAHSPKIPRAGQNIIVTAQVSELSAPIANVTLRYRAMYGDEQSVRMNDSGSRGDAVAGDGIYSAIIPARMASIGEMVRYYVTSQDTSGRSMREPFLPNASNTSGYPEYLGTVIYNPNVNTNLPVFQWFVPDPAWHMRRPGDVNGGNNRTWTTASAFFDGEFYDNIRVRTRGSATVQGWPKPKFKFEFNDAHEFRYADDQERVDEFNLQSHYIEVLPNAGLGSTAVAYMRETLAYEFLQEIGVPASTAFHMRVQQNGEFYSLASFIEQVDRTFLRRNGFNDDGPMYKATPTVQSTLAPNPNPGIYRKVTQKEEPFDDLRELTDGINGRIDGVSVEQYLFDNVNLPQVINEMAGQAILMNHDRLTKNYYMYKDVSGTGEWSRFPWDVEQSFSDPQWDHFVSVLYGDSEHTQGTGNESQYPNHLLDAILDTPRTRQMYLERLRTLIDNYLGTDGPGYFENRIDESAALISPDAALDHARWNAGEIGRGITELKKNIQKRREALASDPLVPRKDLVVRNVELLSETGPVAVLVPSGPNDGNANGTTWQVGNASFPDKETDGWTQGISGVGYDRRDEYQQYFNVDIAADLDPDGDGTNSTNSVYARYKFDVTNPVSFDILELRMRYDDGFVAYLNGVEIARDRVPDTIRWDDRATRGREANDQFDVFPFPTTRPNGVTPILRAGTNVLAIHGLNRSVTDSDMLIQPTLVGGILEPREINVRFGTINSDNVESDNEIVYNPISGNQDEEYISIINAGNAAIDMSGWMVTGGMEVQFQPGTVLAANSTLYVTPDVNAFRARSTGPSGMQSRFVQAADRGHLSNFGETLSLIDNNGASVATVSTPVAPSDVQSYLRVSELHYDPDGQDDGTEFIEFTNISRGMNAHSLDLSGVTISDGPSEPFVFASGTSLA
ncbi:MAG: CotH kinase family protein, partial [Planctomycetales bacterium]|nr:CotH kinase family protein [Planctomycetales bacterium]